MSLGWYQNGKQHRLVYCLKQSRDGRNVTCMRSILHKYVDKVTPVFFCIGGDLGGIVVSMLDCGLTDRPFTSASHLEKSDHLDFPPVVHVCVIIGLGMSSRVYVTGHINNPMPLVVKE